MIDRFCERTGFVTRILFLFFLFWTNFILSYISTLSLIGIVGMYRHQPLAQIPEGPTEMSDMADISKMSIFLCMGHRNFDDHDNGNFKNFDFVRSLSALHLSAKLFTASFLFTCDILSCRRNNEMQLVDQKIKKRSKNYQF